MEINRIYNEDCLDGMKRIPNKSVDMILCDLPYGTTNCKWDAIIPFEPLWEQYKRIIKDNGAIVLTASQPFTSALVMSNIKMFKYEWIWIKNRGTGHLNAKIMPLACHESVLVFCKKKTIYNPQKEKGEPYQRLNCSRDSTNKGTYGKMNKTTNNINNGYRYPKTYLKFDKVERTLHPTQKPAALFEYLIRTYTNEGDSVLDNCMGSGTTAIACINTGRNFIGFELDKNYFEIAEKRIAEVNGIIILG